MSGLMRLLQEIKQLGPAGVIHRGLYEIDVRSGLRYLRTKSLPPEFIGPPPEAVAESLEALFFPRLGDARMFLREMWDRDTKAAVVSAAENVLQNRVVLFSHLQVSCGERMNWHRDPRTGKRWPPREPWTYALHHDEIGDIRVVWELNRFPHFFTLARALVLTGDQRYAEGIVHHFLSWVDDNYFGRGVNWSSGQELALRLMAWIFAFRYVAESAPATVPLWAGGLVRQVRLHALHIERNRDYALNFVCNNHVIAEALGLLLAANAFPFLPEAAHWDNLGRSMLESDRVLRQFYGDGGYCQLSFTYHRLAVQYLLWALRVAEASGKPLAHRVTEALRPSLRFFRAFMNPKSGLLPNWGANDGAVACPWTTCCYGDFRPLVQTLSFMLEGVKVLPPGPWDEDGFWIFGETFAERSCTTLDAMPPVSTFQRTGLVVLRREPGGCVVFRCGSIPGKFGQADFLHVDWWVDEWNVLPDAGSYLYNDELRYRAYLEGTRAHNTIIIDGRDQMVLHRRFTWLYPVRGRIIACTDGKVTGEHDGYLGRGIGVQHRRTVIYREARRLIVKDVVLPRRRLKHEVWLHWNVDVDVWNMAAPEAGIITFHGSKGGKTVELTIKGPSSLHARVRSGYDDGTEVDGWVSRRYAEKTRVASLTVALMTAVPIELTTEAVVL